MFPDLDGVEQGLIYFVKFNVFYSATMYLMYFNVQECITVLMYFTVQECIYGILVFHSVLVF